MRAVEYRCYGPAKDVLRLTTDRPKPKLTHPDHLLIRCQYASINPIDYKRRGGHLAALIPSRFPVVPGLDFAGILVEKHPESSCPWPVNEKTRLFGMLSALGGEKTRKTTAEEGTEGTWAEYVRVDWRRDLVMPVPEYLSTEEAGGVGVCGMTAYMALRHYMGLGDPNVAAAESNKNQSQEAKDSNKKRMLIIGASGGVGTFAVQLAARAYANQVDIVAVCSGRNAERVRQLGAHHVIDYTKGPSLKQLLIDAEVGGVGSYDAIFDFVGGDQYYQELHRLLKPYRPFSDQKGGVFVTATGPYKDQHVTKWQAVQMALLISGRWLGSWFPGLTAPYYFILNLPQQYWGDLVQLMAQHKIHTVMDETEKYELADAAKVHERSESGRARGKLILRIDSSDSKK